MKKKTKHLPASSDEFETPDDLFDELHEEFEFTIDAAASRKNRKLGRYVTATQDAFSQNFDDERVWCNPPYNGAGTVAKWVTFFHDTCYCSDNGPRLVVMLIPTKTEQPFFHELCLGNRYCEIRFVRGRIKFKGGASCGRDTHMIIIFRKPRKFT